MEAKREEMSMALKQVISELYSNGENVSVKARTINRSLAIARTINRSLVSVYRDVRRFESSRSVENLSRTGRPRFIDNREYRRLHRIVNRDRRAPLKEVTALFNETEHLQCFRRQTAT